jgi:hypothetical protein
VVGETDPGGAELKHPDEYEIEPGKGIQVANIHATVLHALGIDHTRELDTPVGRPMALSKGQVIKQLLT